MNTLCLQPTTICPWTLCAYNPQPSVHEHFVPTTHNHLSMNTLCSSPLLYHTIQNAVFRSGVWHLPHDLHNSHS